MEENIQSTVTSLICLLMIKIYEMFENISNYHNKENFYEIAFYSHELKKSNHFQFNFWQI